MFNYDIKLAVTEKNSELQFFLRIAMHNVQYLHKATANYTYKRRHMGDWNK